MNKNKLKGAINRLAKALADCNELGLKLQEMGPHELAVDHYVLHEGALKKIVAVGPPNSGMVAFEGDNTIRQLPNEKCLVLRS